MKKLLTLIVIHQGDKVLLGMKKRGFGAGRWNGFGGKLHEGETIEQAAHREMKEEIGIQASKLDKRGIIQFSWKSKPEEVLEVHIFKVDTFSGQPTEGEEMKPQWFDVDKIPFQDMWPDDIYWFPLFLGDKKFKGRFLFGEKDVILEQELLEVENI